MICVADNSQRAACTIAAGALIQTFIHCEGISYYTAFRSIYSSLAIRKNISGRPNNNFQKVCPMMCWINPSLLAFFPGLSGVRFWPHRGHRIDKEGSTPERSPILCLPTVGMSYTAFRRTNRKTFFVWLGAEYKRVDNSCSVPIGLSFYRERAL
jgi:hypothetical protein